MKIPPFLEYGDAVGIVATAKKVDPKWLEKGITVLQEWGLRPIIGKHTLERNHFFAGSDNDRLTDFQTLLDNPEVKAVFCARGGYGTSRIIDKVNFDVFRKNPKWVVGFSDITVIHIHLNNYGIASLHAPMPAIFHKTSSNSLTRLKDFLFKGEFADISILNLPENKIGEASGELVGGNLSLLAHSLGSSDALNASGKILFIEEVDEPLYKLDRLIVQLKRAGIFTALKGMIVGHISNWTDESFDSTAEKVIRENLEEYTFPIAFGFPAGHEPENYALPLGANFELKVGAERTSLTCII